MGKIEVDMGTRLGSDPYGNLYKGMYNCSMEGKVHVTVKHVSVCKMKEDSWQRAAVENELVL